MNKLLLLFLMLCYCSVNAQIARISFTYDQAGNQTQRLWCTSCNAKNSEPANEVALLKEEDLQKFYPTDDISYYPNPVKEELFLKWPSQDDKKVKQISIYNLSGQLVKQYANLESVQSKSIPFGDYPVASYILVMQYSNGEQKSINILKK